MRALLVPVILIFFMVYTNNARAATDPDICYTRDHLATKNSILAEFSLNSFYKYGGTNEFQQIIIGDRNSRKFSSYSNKDNSDSDCYKLQAEGFGWTSVSSKSKRKKANNKGYKFIEVGDFACDPAIKFCGLSKNLSKRVLAGKGRLLGYGMVNHSVNFLGSEESYERLIWYFYRDKKDNISFVSADAVHGIAIQVGTGKLNYSAEVPGDASIFNTWKSFAPFVEGESLNANVILPNINKPCLVRGSSHVNMEKVWEGFIDKKKTSKIQAFADVNGNWRIISSYTNVRCESILLEGNDLITADYIADKYTAISPIYYEPTNFDQSPSLCSKLSKAIIAAKNRQHECYSYNSYSAALKKVGFLQAMHGRTRDPGNYDYNIIVSVNGKTGTFEIAQLDNNGAITPLFHGTNFKYSSRYQNINFAKRREAIRAEARVQAEIKAARLAKAKREREKRIALRNKDLKERRIAAAKAEKRRIAAMTPFERAKVEERKRFENQIQNILNAMDGVIKRDSDQWLVHSFIPGSLRNLRSRNGRYPNEKILIANYDYRSLFNPSAQGSVEFHMVGSKLKCIKYWDSGCRTPYSSNSWNPNLVTAGILVALLAVSSERN